MATLKAHFDVLARYNAWANRILYNAVGGLEAQQYRQDCGAYFKSIEGTLNHLLVTDRIWRHRLCGLPDPGYRLDQILLEDFPALKAAREPEDEEIARYVLALPESAMDTVISYRRTSTPEQLRQHVGSALAHWFNHQTHHRGQAHAMLTRVSGQAPELDLLFYQRQMKLAAPA